VNNRLAENEINHRFTPTVSQLRRRFLSDNAEALNTGKSTPTLRRWMEALDFVMDEKFSVFGVQFWLRPVWSPRRPIYAALRDQLVALATDLRFAPVSVDR
jgi:hypothetical protein